jgi:hypothetical protein
MRSTVHPFSPVFFPLISHASAQEATQSLTASVKNTVTSSGPRYGLSSDRKCCPTSAEGPRHLRELRWMYFNFCITVLLYYNQLGAAPWP